MKTRKLWWSLLATLMLPLAFALTSCGDDDDDKDGGSSSSLANTAWYGEAAGRYWDVIFDRDGEFCVYETSGYYYYYGEYKVSPNSIKLRGVSGSDSGLRSGTYDYKIRGRKGDREMVIYNIILGGDDMYLEEVEYEGSGSDDDWGYDW